MATYTSKQTAVINAIVDRAAPTLRLLGISKTETRKFVNSVVKTLGDEALQHACQYTEDNRKPFEDYRLKVWRRVLKLAEASDLVRISPEDKRGWEDVVATYGEETVAKWLADYAKEIEADWSEEELDNAARK
jgi:hypothetical protein